jgi:short-subunit dehydrogenase
MMPAHLGIYTATKHAVVAFSEMLRGELEPERIGVSVLCPGLVRSNLGATSARNRPARFGGAMTEPTPPAPEIAAMMMPEEQVGPVVVDAVRANRLHVFTHPEARPMVEARQQRMLDDFAFAAKARERR